MQWLRRRRQRQAAAADELREAGRRLLFIACLLVAFSFSESGNHVQAGYWLALAILVGPARVDLKRVTSVPRYLVMAGMVLMSVLSTDETV